MQQQHVENSVKVDVCGIRRKKSFKSSLSPGSIDNWRNFHWKNVEKFSVKSFAKTHRSVPSPEKTTHSINLSDLLTPHILSSLSYVAAKKPPTRANYNKLFRPLLKKKKKSYIVYTQQLISSSQRYMCTSDLWKILFDSKRNNLFNLMDFLYSFSTWAIRRWKKKRKKKVA